MVRINKINNLQLWDCGPEKAGVGDSIPSLATTFSITYSHSKPSVCSILFQFQNQACRNLPQHKMDRLVVCHCWNCIGAVSIYPREVHHSAHSLSTSI